jgi:HSP20 family protein
MDRLFEESFVRPGQGLAEYGAGTTAVDIFETDDAVVVKSILPGVKPDDIDVSVSGDVLTIRGESKSEEEVKEENYIRREIRYGSFSRSVQIPTRVEAGQAEAEYADGILTLTFPKAEEVKPKAIKVSVK